MRRPERGRSALLQHIYICYGCAQVLEIAAVGVEQARACTCSLVVGDRVLYDQGERWLAGRVAMLDMGRVHVDVDQGLRAAAGGGRLILERNGDLYKAPAQAQCSQ